MKTEKIIIGFLKAQKLTIVHVNSSLIQKYKKMANSTLIQESLNIVNVEGRGLLTHVSINNHFSNKYSKLTQVSVNNHFSNIYSSLVQLSLNAVEILPTYPILIRRN